MQVIVFTEWPGRGPTLVEDQITYPISTTLLSAPRVHYVRGQSFFGLSFVSVIFEDGTDLYWARSRVLEYMSTAAGRLPEGVTPTLGPDATGVGWVYEYALVDRSGQHDLAELRSLQDWNLRYALASVPGVAEVASVGGFVREYQVQVDPNRLRTLRHPARAGGGRRARGEPGHRRRRARDRRTRAGDPRPRPDREAGGSRARAAAREQRRHARHAARRGGRLARSRAAPRPGRARRRGRGGGRHRGDALGRERARA